MSEVKVKAEGGDGGKDREVGEAKKKGYNFKGPQLAKFEGKCEALKGAIYDCSDVKQAADYEVWWRHAYCCRHT